MMGDFDGKIVIVTGAAGGIGRAAAAQFAERGAHVVVADIDGEMAEDVAATIGARAVAIEVDVVDEFACQALVDETAKRFGGVDVLFNNAGIAGARAYTADQTTEDWRRVIDINLNGVFYCTKSAIPEMLNRGGGVVINNASVDGLLGMATVSHYTAAKHGVIGLTKTCALEYGSRNIRCVAIAPGYINTNMTETVFSENESAALISMIPNRRAAEPEEVANLVIWLASESASYVSGTCHTVDAGLTAGFGDYSNV